jgi:hypothetical protein
MEKEPVFFTAIVVSAGAGLLGIIGCLEQIR